MTKSTKETLTGKLSTAKSGTGFVKITNEEGELIEEIIVPKMHLGHAFHGDQVEVEVLPEPFYDRKAGKITKILEMGKRKFTGVLNMGPNGSFFFTADDSKMYTDIFIPARLSKGGEVGMKVYVELKDWDDKQKNPTGEVLEVFGKRGENEAEMRSILVSRGIDYSFPHDVENESQTIGNNAAEIFKRAEEDSDRRDIREIPTFTIDPLDAKDFDDALSLRFNDDDTLEIGVHIADVSHYVVPNSPLDKEARKREFSVYLVDRTIPMLPEVLSNNLCSLRPNEDRLAFTGIFTMKRDGTVLDRWFGRTLIHSNRRFTYEEAQEILNKGEGEFFDELNTMNIVAKKLRKDRFDSGAIDFADTEIKFELDSEGKPIRVYQKERFDAHKLVEEFMLLKNRLVAEEVAHIEEKRDTSLPFMYRTHDNPDRERIESLADFLSAVGFEIPRVDDLSKPEVINQIIESAKGSPLEDLVSTEMLRSMAKAKYSIKNPRHFGLGFKNYCHFTSPIRRYPDLIAHRLFNHYLHGKTVKADEWNLYEAIAELASSREVEVMDAERESIKLKQVEYLASKIGETFNGVISGISEFGFYVEELETKAQGLIRFRTLSDDTYTLDRKTYSATGAAKGKVFRLGDEIKVKLLKADLDQKILDFELA